ncbi:protein of unknown function [Oenococcus oeni]|uniref:Uncharacterized protein n=1 Tax=Oenococcus oeni TaxID=1247 RepID=A0AAQ2USI0_OENOE|nr:hypothetical protein OENI_70001 [Oenococcus oeni]VDB98350.1 protein of unknown function [Oenococcus oeni]
MYPLISDYIVQTKSDLADKRDLKIYLYYDFVRIQNPEEHSL